MEILAVKATYGFIGAAASGGVSWCSNKGMFAQAMPESMNWLVEGGAWLTLVCCLIYAVRSLWAANIASQKKIQQLLEDQQDRDTKTIERMADALEKFNEGTYGNRKD